MQHQAGALSQRGSQEVKLSSELASGTAGRLLGGGYQLLLGQGALAQGCSV